MTVPAHDSEPTSGARRSELQRFSFGRLSSLVAVLDSSGQILRTNAAWVIAAELNGAGSAQAGVGQNYLDVCARSADSSAVAAGAGISSVLQGVTDRFDMEYPCSTPDEERWFLMQVLPAVLDGEPGAVVAHIDITERRAFEREYCGLDPEQATFAVHRSEAMAHALLSHTHDIVAFFDADGTIGWMGGAAPNVLGRSAEDVVGRNGLDWVHPDDQSRFIREFTTMTGLGSEMAVDIRVHAADGTVRWLEVVATNLLDDPTVNAYVAAMRDVTERHVAREAVEFQAQLLAAVGQAVVAMDLDGSVIFWNDAATELYGWTLDEAVGRPILEILRPAEGWQDIASEIHDDLVDGGTWTGEFWVTHKYGTPIPVIVTDTPVRDGSGRQIGTIGVSVDVSDRVEMLRQIADDRRRLADAQAAAKLGTFEIDTDAGIMWRSDELVSILGLLPGDLPALFDNVHPDDRERIEAAYADLVDSGGDKSLTFRVVRPDGAIRWIDVGCRMSTPTTVAGTALDVTDREAAARELAHASLHDALTGLPNREGLTKHLRDTLTVDDVQASGLAVALLDIDHFKEINDTLTHTVGDEALISVADRLRTALPDAYVGRFGGDEFVLLSAGVTSTDAARELGDAALRSLESTVQVGQHGFALTASIGVTIAEPLDTAESLLRDADAAKYQAKADGKARVVVFSASVQAKSSRRMAIEAALRSPELADQLTVLYQPIVRIADDTIAGFEALLRWHHPALGEVPPLEFISVAEANGMIGPIGDRVLREALTGLAAFRALPNGTELFGAVNVSAMQLGRRGFVAEVEDALAATGVPAAALHVEVTENVLIDGIERAVETTRSLRTVGARVSLDDFGTGYSSLGYLENLAVDTVKIDRMFVKKLGDAGHDDTVVRAIAALAGALGLEIVAEGIETRAQRDVIEELGCPYGQGFLWSRPISQLDFLALLTAGPTLHMVDDVTAE